MREIQDKQRKNTKVIYNNKRITFVKGMEDGIPIGLGYIAVAFSLGVFARSAGLNAFQGFFASILCTASAGEYAGFSAIAAGTTLLEIAVLTLIINARYLLMSCALSQRVPENMPWYHRMLMAYTITDEIFGITIAKPGHLNPYYSYGAAAVAAPLWAVGTALGVIAGQVLPGIVVNALSVSLYGMFLAVIIPPAKKDKVLAFLIVLSFAANDVALHLPVLKEISEGMRVVILIVIITSIAAVLFPRATENNAKREEDS